MENLLLNVKNLEIKFKTINGVFDAVKKISFKINRGESIGIIGESGCGKSVTAMSILKLLQNLQHDYYNGAFFFSWVLSKILDKPLRITV